MVMVKGGTVVEKGLYWSPLDGHYIAVQEKSILQGDQNTSFVKLSSSVLLFGAPLLGMMFVLFLPLFGMGVFLAAWLVPLIGTLSAIAITGIRISSGIGGRGAHFNWHPSKSYFSGMHYRGKAGNKRKIETQKAGKRN